MFVHVLGGGSPTLRSDTHQFQGRGGERERCSKVLHRVSHVTTEDTGYLVPVVLLTTGPLYHSRSHGPCTIHGCNAPSLVKSLSESTSGVSPLYSETG